MQGVLVFGSIAEHRHLNSLIFTSKVHNVQSDWILCTVEVDGVVNMWIERKYQSLILDSARTRPAVLLTGPRQTGKTSLLTHLFPNMTFVSLDLPSVAELAEKEPNRFLEEFPPPLIIDEAQYAPELFRHLKLRIDENRDLNGQFLLTGSQKFQLMRTVGDSLAGRLEIIAIEPLSISEIRGHHSNLRLEELIFRGGYPELHKQDEIKPQRFFSSYVASYLERDVKEILNVTNLRDFERFIRALATRSGQLINKGEVAKDVGVSPTTANAWLSVLETSGQICLLEPWYTNKSKQISKSPKLYFNDSGLLAFLLGLRSPEAMLQSPHMGAIWETFVFAELRKKDLHADGFWTWNFYRDRTREIDFLKDEGGVFDLIECKWSERPDKRDVRHMRYFADLLGSSAIRSSRVVARPERAYLLDDFIRVISVSDL